MSNTEAKIERIEGVEATYSPEDTNYGSIPIPDWISGTYALVKDAGFNGHPSRSFL